MSAFGSMSVLKILILLMMSRRFSFLPAGFRRLLISDGGLFSYSDWSCESEKTQKELSSAAKAGMKYYSWFVYQTDSVHMTFFVHCNRPKDTEELKQLYSDLATYINQTAKEYDGGI